MSTALLMCALLSAAPAQAPASPVASGAASKVSASKLEKIHQLLQLTHADQAGTTMLQSLKGHIPPDVYEKLARVIEPGELSERFVAIYDKHFSEAEIAGLIAFYQTPLGQRLVQENAAIAQESVEVGQRYALEKLQQLNTPKSAADAPAKSP